MLYPAYQNLMNKMKENSVGAEESDILDSRYSLVIATAKRARLLIDGEPQLAKVKSNKPVSIAVQEMNNGKIEVKILDKTQE